MKGRSLLVLLAIVAVLTIGTVAAAVYIVKDDGDFIVGGDGSSVSESAEIKDLLPGEARTVTHKAKAKGSADFVVALRQGGENSLDQYISVTLKVNEETVFFGHGSRIFGKRRGAVSRFGRIRLFRYLFHGRKRGQRGAGQKERSYNNL